MTIQTKIRQQWLQYMNESAKNAGLISEQEYRKLQTKIKNQKKASVKTGAFSIK